MWSGPRVLAISGEDLGWAFLGAGLGWGVTLVIGVIHVVVT
jgi:hypothetical protein